MKKYIYGALIGILLAIVMLSVGADTNGAPVLTYVYSNSMEPLIKVNDVFFVWPAKEFKVGDIIMYRPVTLKAPFITHRIITVGNNGYITKGDNSPYKDQDSGEPEVLTDRIIGKVVTVNGQPVIIPGLGNVSAVIQKSLGNYSRYLSVVFFALGLISAVIRSRHSVRMKKPRRRLRLLHIYKFVIISSAVIVMLSVYFGSRVTQIQYLVSEYPGTQGDQVALNQPGRLLMKVNNNGFIPVWTVITGIAPLSIDDAPAYIKSRDSETITLKVLPQRQTGIYQGYVQVYPYPVLLPREWITYLHRVNPVLAIISVGIATGILFSAFFKILSRVPGFDGWIPLRAIKDKLINRRLKRRKAQLLGRRGAR